MYSQNIFRAYDIRGIYPTELDEDFALLVGKAFGTLNPGKIVVGCDVRIGSPSLKKNFIEGLLSTGCDVIDIGTITAPMIIFSTGYYKYDGGVIITASHNPKQFNGFKFYTKGGIPIDGLLKLRELCEIQSFKTGKGKLSQQNILREYPRHLLSHFNFKTPINLKVVIDGGNGSSGKIYSDILRSLGIDVVELFCEPDGNFPNRDPNPIKKEHLIALQNKVKETDADIGIAYDIDADRIGVVDNNGDFVPSKNIFSILIINTLLNNPNEKVVFDVLSSSSIEDIIKANGGIPIACPVGHVFITRKFIEENAILAGELSGHYYYRETFCGEDTLYTSLKLIDYILNQNKPLSECVKGFPDYELQEFRVLVDDRLKFDIVEKIKTELSSNGYDMSLLDGVKVLFKDGWVIFRPSNTGPEIVIGCEGFNKQSFEKYKKFANEMLQKFSGDLSLKQ